MFYFMLKIILNCNSMISDFKENFKSYMPSGLGEDVNNVIFVSVLLFLGVIILLLTLLLSKLFTGFGKVLFITLALGIIISIVFYWYW